MKSHEKNADLATSRASRNFLSPLFSAAALALAGCGGGSESGSSATSEPSGTYYGVTGVKDGSSTTICLDNAAYIDPQSDNGKAVTAAIVNYYGLTGSTNSISGNSQSCASKFPLATSIITVDFYNKVVVPAASAPPPTGTGSGGTGAGTGTGTGSGSGSGSAPLYIEWNGSSNGTVVVDSNNDHFAVSASTMELFYQRSTSDAVRLNGLTLNSTSQIVDAGVVRGYVGLADSTSGGKIAALYCSDGSLMNINISSTWTMVCSGNNTGTGGAGGSGSPGGSGGGSQTSPPTRSFINWYNSLNGKVVNDAGNEKFSFYADTRCIFSHKRQVETSNFCLSSGNTGSFAGQPVKVMLAAATSGGCIAVLASPNGNQIDIFTSPAGIQTVTQRNTQWDTSGCTR